MYCSLNYAEDQINFFFLKKKIKGSKHTINIDEPIKGLTREYIHSEKRKSPTAHSDCDRRVL